MDIRRRLSARNHTPMKRSPGDISWLVFHGEDGLGEVGDIGRCFDRRPEFSADLWVDPEGGVWQTNDYWSNYSWGVGAYVKPGTQPPFYRKAFNKNSVNVVLCVPQASGEDRAYTPETLDSAAALAVYLMQMLGIGIGHIIRRCEIDGDGEFPAVVMPGSEWDRFKEKVMQAYNEAGDPGHTALKGNAPGSLPNYLDAYDGVAADGEPEERMKILTEQLQEFYATICLNHKMQEIQSEIYRGRYDCLQTVNILLGAITSAGIISIIFTDGFCLKLITAAMAVVTTAISSYNKAFDLNTMSQKHKDAALKLLDIKNRFLMLLCDVKMHRVDEQTAVEKRDAWMAQLEEIFSGAGEVSQAAYRRALEIVKSRDKYSFTEEEIEKILPEYLRDGP